MTGSEWRSGAVAGLVAGVVMGALMTTLMRGVIENAIPALVGLSGIGAGWVVHLGISTVFGLAFAAVASVGSVRGYVDAPGSGAVLGIGYGVVLWVVAAAVVMPVWLSAVGFPGAPDVPNVNVLSLAGHAVYGGVLGVLYPYLR